MEWGAFFLLVFFCRKGYVYAVRYARGFVYAFSVFLSAIHELNSQHHLLWAWFRQASMSDRSHSISDVFCVTNRFAQSTKETDDFSSAGIIAIGTYLTGCLRGINTGLCC